MHSTNMSLKILQLNRCMSIATYIAGSYCPYFRVSCDPGLCFLFCVFYYLYSWFFFLVFFLLFAMAFSVCFGLMGLISYQKLSSYQITNQIKKNQDFVLQKISVGFFFCWFFFFGMNNYNFPHLCENIILYRHFVQRGRRLNISKNNLLADPENQIYQISISLR